MEKKWIPSYPLIRPRDCPSGPPRHPVNWDNPEQCGLGRLMRDEKAGEGLIGLMSGWTKRSFTADQLAEYEFSVVEEAGEIPQARCLKCGLEMSLRRDQS